MGYTTRRRLHMETAVEIASKSVYTFAKVNNISTAEIVKAYESLGRKVTMKEVDLLIQTNKQNGNKEEE